MHVNVNLNLNYTQHMIHLITLQIIAYVRETLSWYVKEISFGMLPGEEHSPIITDKSCFSLAFKQSYNVDFVFLLSNTDYPNFPLWNSRMLLIKTCILTLIFICLWHVSYSSFANDDHMSKWQKTVAVRNSSSYNWG